MAPPGLLRRIALPALLAAAALAAAPAAQADRGTTVPDTRPGWATPANDSGDAAAGGRVVFSVWLGWRNGAQLDALLADQQDPSSPGYHRWLSSRQFRDRFAPDEHEVKQVTRWLASQKFDLVTVPRNKLFVTAAGSVAQVEQTFRVNETLYSVDGQLVRAPDARSAHPRRAGRPACARSPASTTQSRSPVRT